MKRSLFLLTFSLTLLAPVFGQTLDLDSCISLALAHNKQLQSAQLLIRQQQQTQKAYRANYFPNIKASVTDVWGNIEGERTVDIATPLGQAIGGLAQKYAPALSAQQQALLGQALQDVNGALPALNPTIDYRMGNVLLATLTLEQPLYMGGKITAAYRMGRLGTEMAKAGAAKSHDETVVSTYEAYALLLKAEQMHRVALQYDSLLSRLLTDVTNARRHGLSSNNDVLKVQVKKNEAELQVRQADNGIRLARMNLCQIVGLPLLSEVQTAGDVEVSPEADLTRSAGIESRPEYTYLALKSELAAWQVKLERAELLPQVGVGATFGYNRGLKLMGERLLGDDPFFAAMVSLTIPIYHGGEAQHKLKAARLARERATLEQQDLSEKLSLELQQAANLLDEAILEAELCDRSATQAAESLRESRRSYDLGLESLSDLLTTQVLWQQATAQQAIAHAQVLVQTAKFRKASGSL